MIPAKVRVVKTGGLPMPVMILGGVVVVVLAVVVWGALSMGTPPVQNEVSVDIPVKY